MQGSDRLAKEREGVPDGDVIVAKAVDLGIAPRALLSRRLVVTYIAIKGVRGNLLRDLAGRMSYDFGPLARWTGRNASN